MNQPVSTSVRALALGAAVMLHYVAYAAANSGTAAKNSSTCADVPHSDHPKAMLSNGTLDALVFLPDAKNGYYRSTRFDWSGVVGCVSLNGHKFFGEWFAQYDPLKNDSMTGPVEEFRSDDGPLGHNGPRGEFFVRPGAIGYNEAKPGELFLKPGVGVLRKVDNSPYQFGGAYPIVDTGRWTKKVKPRSVVFRQVLNGPEGYAYVYEKTLVLDKNDPVMTLDHSLKIQSRRRSIPTFTTTISLCSTASLSGPGWSFTSRLSLRRRIPLARRQRSRERIWCSWTHWRLEKAYQATSQLFRSAIGL